MGAGIKVSMLVALYYSIIQRPPCVGKGESNLFPRILIGIIYWIVTSCR